MKHTCDALSSAHVQYRNVRAAAGEGSPVRYDMQGLPVLPYVSRPNEKLPEVPGDRG